jgi:hypothetical protein
LEGKQGRGRGGGRGGGRGRGRAGLERNEWDGEWNHWNGIEWAMEWKRAGNGMDPG